MNEMAKIAPLLRKNNVIDHLPLTQTTARHVATSQLVAGPCHGVWTIDQPKAQSYALPLSNGMHGDLYYYKRRT